jgi:D-alanyl-D-alanine carboxypeptidase (penicillin-binding protein 5/6)
MHKILVIFLSIILCTSNAFAAKKCEKKKRRIIKAPTQASLVLNEDSGNILHFSRASNRIYPASTIKMMTIYLTFDALNSGKLKLSQKIPVSLKAQKMRPSKLWLKAGQKITVRQAILGLHIKSANDAAVVLAEAIAGTEENFAKMMNAKAKKLGMTNTNIVNASGWHHSRQYSTALDLARLGIALKNDHTKYELLLKQKSFKFKGQKINSHNSVLAYYPGANCGKTGFHTPGGYNLVVAANRNGKNLVAVITGGRSAKHRDKRMVNLLDKHFDVAYNKKKPGKKKALQNKTFVTNKKPAVKKRKT